MGGLTSLVNTRTTTQSLNIWPITCPTFLCTIIYLSGDDLVRIWQGDELPFEEKYLSTLWWGGKTRHAASAYSVNNIERMGNPGLPAALQLVSDANSFEEAKEYLQIVYQSLERGGDFSVRQVGPPFFPRFLNITLLHTLSRPIIVISPSYVTNGCAVQFMRK